VDTTGQRRWIDNVLIHAFPNGASLFQCGLAELMQPGWPANIGLVVMAAHEVKATIQSCVTETFDAAMNDAFDPPEDEAQAIWDLANKAADRGKAVLDSGRSVVSCCAMGHNRSALISGLILVRCGVPWRNAIDLTRHMRGPLSFNNPTFVGMVARNGPVSKCKNCGSHVRITE
jgi:hypothetical protein